MDRFHRSKPIVCGPHRLFNHRFKKRQLALKLTYRLVTDRSKPIVGRHDHRLKTHACSESSRRMLGRIELHFFSTLCVLRHRVLTQSDFERMVCTHIRPSGRFSGEPMKTVRRTILIGLVRPCVQGLRVVPIPIPSISPILVLSAVISVWGSYKH